MKEPFFIKWLKTDPFTEPAGLNEGRALYYLKKLIALAYRTFSLAILYVIIIWLSWQRPLLAIWAVVFIASVYLSIKCPVLIILSILASSALSPRINLGIISANIIGIRLDDILIISLFLATILNYAKGRLILKPLSPAVPFLIFICIGAISLLRGIFIHTIDKPIVSLLVMFKWAEYLVIFYLAYLYLNLRAHFRLIIIVLICAGLLVSLYGYWEYFHPQQEVSYMNYYRLYDRGIYLGQNNHMAGFFVLWFGIIVGLFFYLKNYRYKVSLGISALFGLLPFISTYSRKSYIALAVTMSSLILFTKKRRYVLLFLILFLIVSVLFGARIFDRLKDMADFFVVKDAFRSQRFYFFKNWANSLKTIENYPLLGAGFGSRHRLYYESQPVMLIAETGILGLLAFYYLLILIFRMLLHNYRNSSDLVIRGFTAGFLAAFLGILIHSLTCISMVVARIAIPFWLISGMLCNDTRKLSGQN